MRLGRGGGHPPDAPPRGDRGHDVEKFRAIVARVVRVCVRERQRVAGGPLLPDRAHLVADVGSGDVTLSPTQLDHGRIRVGDVQVG
jgi:hypothetical protein